MFQDDPDSGDEAVERYLEEHGERLRNAALSAAEDLAEIGVYLDSVTWFVDTETGDVNVGFHGIVNEWAFGERIQSEQLAVDEEFDDITEMLVDDEYRRAWWELGHDD